MRNRLSIEIKKLKYEDDFKNKNNPCPVISRTYYLSNKTISGLSNLVRLSL
jgi:hypothetical protein